MSSGLSLALLNDYIAPSQECVKPVERLPEKPLAAREIQFEDASNGFQNGVNGHSTTANAGSGALSASGFVSNGISKEQNSEPATQQPASITLADCLACSGCITTAESVLVAMQSHKDIENVLRANEIARATDDPVANGYKRVVVTISPQSRASIANKYGLDSRSVHARLVWWLKRIGVHEVWDVGRARSWALEEIGTEFMERLKVASMGAENGAVNGNGFVNGQGKVVDNREGGPLPLLASGCPGFVCYLETTHPGYLPHLSSVRSPLSLLSSMLKSRLSKQWGLKPENIWHVSIAPCYDKKLEASRPELSPEGIRDTDCVVTTSELELLWREQGLSFPQDFEEADLSADPWYRPLALPMSSSGGTLPSLLLLALRELFGTAASPADLEVALATGSKDFGNGVVLTSQPGKNVDVRDWIVTAQGSERLRFGQSFGFRNIQNTLRRLPAPSTSAAAPEPTSNPAKPKPTVRKLRAGKESAPYHFVEVMACPSGCLNGGGQLKPDPTAENPSSATTQGWLDGVRARYEEEMQMVGGGDAMDVDGSGAGSEELYEVMGGRGSDEARRLMRTVYRGIVKDEGEAAGLTVKW